MNSNTTPKMRQAQVKSHVPGRLRFKLHHESRDPETLEGIQRTLKTMQGIDEVRVNSANGSVTVNYDHAHHSMSGILCVLEDLDVLVESIGHLPSVGDSNNANGATRPEFLVAIDELNRLIRQKTALPINLKLLLPLSFLGAGIWSIGRRGLMIESVPGWLFLWFAFDMFVKLHPVKHPQE